ncbi:MAG: AAA family ATPase [Chloroherpetonaceae bacterium]|nr:AAA family ATPase [Chloroherpetonaceae bacterium]
MENILESYLESTKVKRDDIQVKLHHPITEVKYPQRFIFEELKELAKGFYRNGYEPRMVALAGLRGVGKTTLLWQLAEEISHDKIENIYFINVSTLNSMGIDLHLALDIFQKKILKKRFSEYKEPLILFFDEIQDDPKWSITLKVLFEEARSAFIAVTGSSALLLQSTADLARRMLTKKVYPFSFTEYCIAKIQLSEKKKKSELPSKGISDALKNALFYSETVAGALNALKALEIPIEDFLRSREKNIDEDIQKYIDYQNFPALLFYNNRSAATVQLQDLIQRIIYTDIPSLNKERSDTQKIERLLLRLAASDEINPEKLASLIGVKSKEISDYLELLSKAELLHILMPYGGIHSKIMKNRKGYFMSPSLRRALLIKLLGEPLTPEVQSKLIEDTVVMVLKKIFFLADTLISFTSGSHEANPDFIIETRDSPVIIEVGATKRKSRQIENSEIKSRYGVVISNGIESPTLVRNVIQLPMKWFLML